MAEDAIREGLTGFDALPSQEKRRPGRPPGPAKPKAAAPAPAPIPDAASFPAAAAVAPERREMRAESPRAASESREQAAIRAAQIMEGFDGTEGNDDFLAPAPPDGWSYEWKRKTTYNQEDPAYTVSLRRTGWAEVPRTRHPEMMPVGWKGNTIERKGMVLMERPEEITNRFKERDRKAARDQVRTKEEQLSAAPPGTFDRQNKDSSLARIKKGYEPMPIPEK